RELVARIVAGRARPAVPLERLVEEEIPAASRREGSFRRLRHRGPRPELSREDARGHEQAGGEDPRQGNRGYTSPGTEATTTRHACILYGGGGASSSAVEGFR